MNRKEITKKLSELTEQYINPRKDPRIYWAKEVTFDYGTDHQTRVDYMTFAPCNNTVSGIEKGNFYCYEIKSCVADFNNKHGHNFIGDFNYYVMLESTYKQTKDQIPLNVGVLIPGDTWDTSGTLRCIKSPRHMYRSRPVSEMLLMMFRSANRERNARLTVDRYTREGE